jgi:hypothetical protein
MNEWLIAAMFFKGEMPMNQWMRPHGGASLMALLVISASSLLVAIGGIADMVPRPGQA